MQTETRSCLQDICKVGACFSVLDFEYWENFIVALLQNTSVNCMARV